MPNPSDAPLFKFVPDPSDEVDFVYQISQGSTEQDTLQVGEGIASLTLAPTPVAVAAGLQLGTGSRATAWGGLIVGFWMSIAALMRSSPNFDGPGLTLGIEQTIITTSSPARTLQRTLLVQVRNR